MKPVLVSTKRSQTERMLDGYIDDWLRGKEDITTRQYSAHIRQLRSKLQRKRESLATASRAGIVAFVRSYQTYWARRRALTVVRSCFAFLNEASSERVPNVAAGISIDEIESDVEQCQADAQMSLLELGWEERRVEGVSWASLLKLVLDDDLPEEALVTLQRLVSRRLMGRSRSTRKTVVFPPGFVKEKAS